VRHMANPIGFSQFTPSFRALSEIPDLAIRDTP
jgi:hypothetical protein